MNRSVFPAVAAATLALLVLPLPLHAESPADMRAGDAVRGEVAYAEDCASCHRTPARFMANVPGQDAAARATWLEDFLPDHYAPDAQTRADIVAWLLAE